MLRLRRDTHKAPFLKVQCSTHWLKWRRDIFIFSDSVDGGGKLLTVVTAVWLLHCRCSLQNWTTPKLRKILLDLSLSLAFSFFLCIFWWAIHLPFTAEENNLATFEILKLTTGLLIKTSNSNNIYLKYLLASKKENFINITLLYLLFHTVPPNLSHKVNHFKIFGYIFKHHWRFRLWKWLDVWGVKKKKSNSHIPVIFLGIL